MSSPFLAAPGGSRGTTGPQGPQGTPGANGLSLDVFLYKFSSAVTGTPAAGFLRLDSATAPTRLVIATVDASGRDQTTLLQVALGGSGSKIRVQLRTNVGSWIEVTSTGAPVAVVPAIEWPVTSLVVGPAGAPLNGGEVFALGSSDTSALSAAITVLQQKTVALTTNGRFGTAALPETSNAVDLGSGTYRWKDMYMLGTLRCSGPTGLAVDRITNVSEQSGINLLPGGPDCKIQLSGTDYKGNADRAVTLATDGTLQKSGATISAAGDVTCASVTTNSITGNAAGPSADLELKNQAGVGLTLVDGAAGSIKLTGSNYTPGHAGKLLSLDAAGALVPIAVSGGDVVGPAGAADEALARFDTATGKLLKSSSVTLTNSGILNGATGINLAAFALVQGSAATFEGSVFKGNNFDSQATAQLLNPSNFGLAVKQDGGVRCTAAAYTGNSDRAVTLATDGTLQKTAATISAAGNILGQTITATGDMSCVNLAASTALRSNDWFNLTNNAGVNLAPGAAGAVLFRGTNYTGHVDRVVTLAADGTLQKSGATISGAGVGAFSQVKTGIVNAPTQTVGLTIDDTPSGDITLTGTAYTAPSAAGKALTLDGVGKLTPTAVGSAADVATLLLRTAKLNTSANLTSTTSPATDNAIDLGSSSVRFRDVYTLGVKEARFFLNSSGRGIELSGTSTAADVVLTANPYQGNTTNSIMTIGNTGAIKVPSSNARIDSLGNLDCRGAVLTSGDLEIATSGKKVLAEHLEVKAVSGGPLKLYSYQGRGIRVSNDTAATVSLTGSAYTPGHTGKVLSLDAAGALVPIAVSGDVVGPAGATDEALARFDTASGKLLKSSSVTLSNTGLVSGVEYMTFGSNNVRLAGAFNVVGPSNPSGSVANICIGNGAGQALTSGGTNVCVGDVAAPNVGAGNGNVFIGQLASVGMTSGNGNVFIGDNTPSFAAAASNNVIVGARSKAGGNNSIAIGADVETGLGVPTDHACIGNNGIVALYNQGNASCDLGRTTNRFKDLHLGGVARLSGYTASAGKLFTVNPSGDLIPMNLVGPGTLRVDANGLISVLLDPPPIITPHDLTSNTSHPTFTVSTSGVLLNSPGTWGGWRAFDELGSNGHWGSFNQSFSNSTGVQITGVVAPMPSPGSWIAAVLPSDRTISKVRYKTMNTGIPADFTVARYNGSSWIDTGFSVTNAPNTPGSPYIEYTIPGANGGGGPWRGIAMIISRLHNWDGNDVCYISELDFQ